MYVVTLSVRYRSFWKGPWLYKTGEILGSRKIRVAVEKSALVRIQLSMFSFKYIKFKGGDFTDGAFDGTVVWDSPALMPRIIWRSVGGSVGARPIYSINSWGL